MFKKLSLVLILVVLFSIPVFVFSANPTGLNALKSNLDRTGQAAGADTSGDLQTIVGTGINAALTLIGLIFLILMVYAGYLWMTARGSEEVITKSKGIVTAAIIGLVLVVSAYAITAFVTGRFETGNQPALGCCTWLDNETEENLTVCEAMTQNSCDTAKQSAEANPGAGITNVQYSSLRCEAIETCPKL